MDIGRTRTPAITDYKRLPKTLQFRMSTASISGRLICRFTPCHGRHAMNFSRSLSLPKSCLPFFYLRALTSYRAHFPPRRL